MPKGYFTQGLTVLFTDKPSTDQIKEALGDEFGRVAPRVAGDKPHFGGAGVTVSFRPEVNGVIDIDVFEAPWPDSMGDPKADSALFGAWGMGFFGPFTYPGNLERALQHDYIWQAASLSLSHRVCVRIRASYVFGAGPQARIIPDAYDAVAELMLMTNVARCLLRLPGATAYFCPGGEVVLDAATLDAALQNAVIHHVLPLDVWSNARLFKIDDDWSLMDVVGNGQLDCVDLEVAYRPAELDGNQVMNFLRNVTSHLVQNGPVFKHGETVNGPGGDYQIYSFRESVVLPPRHVLFFELTNSKTPNDLLSRPVSR
jgi:hypothetical protein